MKKSVLHVIVKMARGIMNAEGKTWTYPPLWGKDSYNDGAGLFRLSRFAGYIKANMPLGATYNDPQLSTVPSNQFRKNEKN